MPTRVPKAEDFDDLSSSLKFTLTYPEVPETTTAILIIFHGLGDSERAFTTFAQSTNLPGVLGISVRGVNHLPPTLLGLPEGSAPTNHFHWGDDLTISPTTGELDTDPGYTKALDLVLGKLIRETLIGKCGWDTRDILLFGFGQGGSLALGLASKLRGERVVDVTNGKQQTTASGEENTAFKGVVAIGGPLPASTIPTLSAREKARSPVLVCHGRTSEAVDDDALEVMRNEFVDVREVKWQKPDDGMPGSREEMLPIMQFFAERLAANGF